jgi:hypothetical protein
MKCKDHSAAEMETRCTAWGFPVAALLVLLFAMTSGCRLLQSTANLPGQTFRTVTGGSKKSNAPDPVELQQQLLRFADDYSGRLLVASDSLNATTNVISPTELIRLKLNFIGGCFAVATGPNATVNLLDMFVLVTMARTMVEEQWLPGAYGESARPMLEACRLGETEIKTLATAVLKPEQLEELGNAIAQWRQDHPDIRSAVFTRALGLAAEISTIHKEAMPASGSVFSLLMLDPLAGLDPAARELAQTRLFAERALFLAQRMPMLLRWQTELLALETAEAPAVREWRANMVQLTAALERTSRVAEELPALVRSEREAILKAVASQETGLTNVATQLKATLDTGRQMSDSVNTILTTFDQLQKNLRAENSGKTESSAGKSEPFRIRDYAETAQNIDQAAERLTGLLRTFEQTLASTNLTGLSAQFTPAVQEAQAEGRELVNYIFRMAVLLVAISCVLAVASVLLCQRLRRRQTAA